MNEPNRPRAGGEGAKRPGDVRSPTPPYRTGGIEPRAPTPRPPTPSPPAAKPPDGELRRALERVMDCLASVLEEFPKGTSASLASAQAELKRAREALAALSPPTASGAGPAHARPAEARPESSAGRDADRNA